MEQKIKINCVIGIDPGANGGIAVYVPDRPVNVAKMPKDIRDLRDFLDYYKDENPIVFLEKLSIRPDDVMGEGDAKNLGKLYRIQKMMANFEQLKAIIESEGIPYVMVHPLSWQTKLKLRIRGVQEEKSARKERYKQAAMSLYPGAKITLWSADALLIMHFGRWVLVNDPKWVKSNLPEREYQKLF